MPMKTNPETGLPEYDPEIEEEADEIADLKSQIATLTQAIHMLVSALKSGEQWSDTLRREVNEALGKAPDEAPTA
jgi:chromosome segregation ATPase